MLGISMPIEVLAVMKAFVSVMPLSSNGDVQKQPEAAFLRVVKAIVERPCCTGEFFQLGRAGRKALSPLLEAFDDAAMLLRFLGLFTPFRYPRGARFRLFA